jgi:hypothetical protein
MGMKKSLLNDLSPRGQWRVVAFQLGLIALIGALS